MKRYGTPRIRRLNRMQLTPAAGHWPDSWVIAEFFGHRYFVLDTMGGPGFDELAEVRPVEFGWGEPTHVVSTLFLELSDFRARYDSIAATRARIIAHRLKGRYDDATARRLPSRRGKVWGLRRAALPA